APRIGICRSPTWDMVEPATEALLPRIATALGRVGAMVRDFELPDEFAALKDAHPIVMNSESARALGWELGTCPDGLSDGLRERMEFGLSQSDAARANALAVFERTQQGFAGALGELDVLITPSAPGEAPEGLEWTGDPAFNFIWTSLHVPCVTVPAGLGRNGLPLGIQIVGRRGEDRAVLAWAQWVAAAIG
ncbi:MAG: amidase family protein, partial [Acetobacteraceae bacterium]